MSHSRSAVLIAVTAFVLAGCGWSTSVPASTPGRPSPGVTAATSSSPAANARTMVFGSASDPTTVDAILLQDGESLRIAQQIYDTLIRLKPGTAADLEPSLAKSWAVSPDGLTYTFHLRSGVRFTDGTPFDADAAVYNVNRWKNLPVPLRDSDYYDRAVFGGYGAGSLIDSATNVDGVTLRIKLRRPKADFLMAMTLVPFAMQSPTALQAHHADLAPSDPTNDYWQTAPTGTGPFMFKEFIAGERYSIVRNPDYWDSANAAFLDSVVFKPIPDADNRLAALKSGVVDIIDPVNGNQLADVSADARFQLLKRTPLAVGKVGFNQGQKPFDDLNVRKAAAYAIDRKAVVETFFPGLGTVADSDLISTMAAYEANATISGYNPQEARALLAASSCPAPCAIDFWYADNTPAVVAADPKGEFELIRANLEAVGFKVNPRHVAWQDGYLAGAAQGKYPAFLIGWTYDYADPADGPGIFYATSMEACDGIVPTSPHNCEFAQDDPIAAAAMAKAIAEPDAARRTQDWKDAMRLINADVPDVPLVWVGSALAATKSISGYIPSPTQSESLNLVVKVAP